MTPEQMQTERSRSLEHGASIVGTATTPEHVLMGSGLAGVQGVVWELMAQTSGRLERIEKALDRIADALEYEKR